MAVSDDSELLRFARQGDATAFDILVRRHDRFLYRVARSILLDDYEAEDVIQETFLKAFKGLVDFRQRARQVYPLGSRVSRSTKRLRESGTGGTQLSSESYNTARMRKSNHLQ